MKRKFWISLLLSVFPSWAFAQSIHVEWGYTPPSEPQVTGFRLYQEGVGVCWWAGRDTTAGDCEVTLPVKITNFTLTATFDDSTESPHSSPFAFDKDSATLKFRIFWMKPGQKPVRLMPQNLKGARIK